MYHGSGEGGQNGRRKRERGAKINARLMTREMAIQLVNPSAIEDRIWQVFVGPKVHRDVRRPLMWLAPPEVKYNTHPAATKLNELVQTANERKIPATRRTIKRSVDLDLISEEVEGRETFYYVDAHQFATTNFILLYRDMIQDVVRKQVADPYNPTAGIELFERLANQLPKNLQLPNGVQPSEVASKVYYNIIDVANFPAED
jgi:hypothetical protein